MAVISPAIGIQSGSHSALSFRQLAAALTGIDPAVFTGGVGASSPGHGVSRRSHLAVSQNGTPNMSVNVAAGTALVQGTSLLAQGVYAVTNDAVTNLSVATADATNPRRDLVVIQVRDNTADAGGVNDARLFVVTGTPAAAPVDPAVPAGCVVLARVQVNALATSIVNANITDLRVAVPRLASRGVYANRNISATNTFIDQTTNAFMPVAGDRTALTTTLIKQFADTALRLEMNASIFLNSGLTQTFTIGLRIGSTDYDVARHLSPEAIFHNFARGFVLVDGVAAGVHTVEFRFRAAGASAFRLNTDDSVQYAVTEMM